MFPERQEAHVAPAAGGCRGMELEALGEGETDMSLRDIVRPSTMIIGGRGASPNQPAHLSSPTCFQRCL